MWLECSDCGERFESDAKPPVCGSCGTAGVFFATVEGRNEDSQPDSLSAAWTEAGFDLGRTSEDALAEAR